MLNELGLWEITGLIFTVVLGTLLHFVYGWSGRNQIAALFSPVNESAWEHLKLLSVPMVLFGLAEYFAVGKNYPNFIAAKSYGVLLGMLVILIVFYTYTGIIGENFLWADILTFLLGVASAALYSWKMIGSAPVSPQAAGFAVVLILLFAAFFAVFTRNPPHIPLFRDPVSGAYGIPKKADSHR